MNEPARPRRDQKVDVRDMRTLKALYTSAKEHNLTVEEKHGGYRVTRFCSIKDLSIEWRQVEAGAGYSLNLEELRAFLRFQ